MPEYTLYKKEDYTIPSKIEKTSLEDEDILEVG